MLKFLPGAVEKFRIEPKHPYSGPPYSVLSRKSNILRLPVCIAGTSGVNEYWIRLGFYNVFPILPTIFLKVVPDGNDKHIQGEIRYGALSKPMLTVWLWLAVIVYFAFSLHIAFEQFFGDGFVPYTFNGETGRLPVLPWIPAFLGAHFIGFLVLPGAMITFGWKKTKALVDELKEILETEPT